MPDVLLTLRLNDKEFAVKIEADSQVIEAIRKKFEDTGAAAGNTIAGMRDKLKGLITNLEKTEIGTDAFKRLKAEVAQTETELTKAAGATQPNPQTASQWGMIATGIQSAYQSVRQFIGEMKQLVGQSVVDAAALDEMKSYFKGSADELENLRQITKNTASDGNLIRLSNHATELGITIKEEQPILFAMAKRVQEISGGTMSLDEAMMKLIMATEGQAKGLALVNIESKVFTKTAEEMAKARGQNIMQMDGELQKEIRKQALLKLGLPIYIEMLNSLKSDADKLESLGVEAEHSRLRLGKFILDGLSPLIGKLDATDSSLKKIIFSVYTIGTTIVGAIPLIVQLYTAKKLLGIESAITAGKVAAETTALEANTTATIANNTAKLGMLGWAGAIGAAIIGAGALYIWTNKVADASARAAANFGKFPTLERNPLPPSQRFSFGSGDQEKAPVVDMSKFGVINTESSNDEMKKVAAGFNLASASVAQMRMRIQELETANNSANITLEQLHKNQKEIENINQVLTPKKLNNENNITALANEKKQYEELEGKIAELNIQKNKQLSDYEKELAVLHELTKAKLAGLDAEEKTIKDKKEKTPADNQKLINIQLEKKVIEAEANAQEEKITKEHNDKLLESDLKLDEQKLELEKKTSAEIIKFRIEHYKKLLELEPDPVKKKDIQEKLNQAEIDLLKNTEDKKKAYYDKVKFLDANYLSDRLRQIDEELNQMRTAGLTEIELTNFKNESIKQLETEYYDWKWQQYKKDHQLFTGSMDAMWAGYDTFFQTITDRSMTGSDRLNAVWDSIKNSFVNMLANMLKEYLQSLIINALITKPAQLAAVEAAAATGSGIASAYAPAAAFASVMSFGSADLIGAAGLSSTVALAYLLSAPKITGFEKGGIVVGENGPEVIAPMQDYASGQAQLVTEAVMAVQQKLMSLNFEVGINGGENNNKELIEEMKKTNGRIDQILKTPIWITDDACGKIYERGRRLAGYKT